MPVSYTVEQRRFLGRIEQALRDHMQRAEPRRYEHSLSVARTAEDMALRYAQDPFEARVAGTLHDWDKVLSNDEQLALARRQGVDMGVDLELVCPLLHGITAAGHLREEVSGLSDAVLRAIALHTLGSTDMRPLDMIVFVADAIEPLRPSSEGIDQVRALVRAGAPLAEAYASCFCSGVEYVIRTRRYLYPKTLDIYNHLVLTRRKAARTH